MFQNYQYISTFSSNLNMNQNINTFSAMKKSLTQTKTSRDFSKH